MRFKNRSLYSVREQSISVCEIIFEDLDLNVLPRLQIRIAAALFLNNSTSYNICELADAINGMPPLYFGV